MTIGERIKQLRIASDMSWADLAIAIKSTKQAIFKYENNIITKIPPAKVEAMALLFGVTASYLMGWEECNPETSTVTTISPVTKK